MTKKKEIVLLDDYSLKDKIYIIRGVQVMLDFELAEIYGYTVSAFNQQVKRNIDRFPEDFMFRIKPEEIPESLKSQNVILNESGNKRGMHIKKMPYAFTEQGIYMLMTVLKGDLAIQQSKTLIRLFKSMKDYLVDNKSLLVENKYDMLLEDVERHDVAIKNIQETMVTKADLSDFMKLFDSNRDNEEILILDGQPFKADLAYQKIYKKAKKNIVVIDDYINIKTLYHLSTLKNTIKITIISDNKGKQPLRLSEYNDYLTEYSNINISFIKSLNRIHDRYIVLDNNTKNMKVYHCGASSKDAGNRITTITQLRDITQYKDMVKTLLNNPLLELK